MELQQCPDLPRGYHNDPSELTLKLPSVPNHELDKRQPLIQADIRLPSLTTVLSPEFQDALPYNAQGSPSVRRTNPENTHTTGTRRSIESALISPSEAGSVRSSEDRNGRATSVVSIDDPDVRIAAEALSGLGNPDFARFPQNGARSHESASSGTRARGACEELEPLLELFAQAHPWVGGTINGTVNGSMAAYATTKHYSPRFVQYGVKLVEQNIATPVVNTVGTVGRYTGVEGGIRRYLGGGRRGNELDRDDREAGASKRRRVMEDEMDVESGLASPSCGMRRDSVDSRTEPLPAYRASKPPSYREEASPSTADQSKQADRPAHVRSWSSQVAGQVFVMTSGLGVALSVTSRRSLQYCLNMLSHATEHVATVMDALKLVLEQYDQARASWHQQNAASMERGERPRTPDHDQAARHLASIIQKHSADIWQTLKHVVNSVSNTAGGALPENARHFVRTQLMSLPQRWRIVSDRQTGDSETSRGAHRMVEFATEGLDMMSQVSQVVTATLDSAERWLDRVGRRRGLDEDDEKDQDMRDVDCDAPAVYRSQHLDKQYEPC